MRSLDAYHGFRHTLHNENVLKISNSRFTALKGAINRPGKERPRGKTNRSCAAHSLPSLPLSLSPPRRFGGSPFGPIRRLLFRSGRYLYLLFLLLLLGGGWLSGLLPAFTLPFHRCQLQISLLEVHFLPIRRRRHSPKRRIRTPLQGYLEDREGRVNGEAERGRPPARRLQVEPPKRSFLSTLKSLLHNKKEMK